MYDSTIPNSDAVTAVVRSGKKIRNIGDSVTITDAIKAVALTRQNYNVQIEEGAEYILENETHPFTTSNIYGIDYASNNWLIYEYQRTSIAQNLALAIYNPSTRQIHHNALYRAMVTTTEMRGTFDSDTHWFVMYHSGTNRTSAWRSGKAPNGLPSGTPLVRTISNNDRLNSIARITVGGVRMYIALNMNGELYRIYPNASGTAFARDDVFGSVQGNRAITDGPLPGTILALGAGNRGVYIHTITSGTDNLVLTEGYKLVDTDEIRNMTYNPDSEVLFYRKTATEGVFVADIGRAVRTVMDVVEAVVHEAMFQSFFVQINDSAASGDILTKSEGRPLPVSLTDSDALATASGIKLADSLIRDDETNKGLHTTVDAIMIPADSVSTGHDRLLVDPLTRTDATSRQRNVTREITLDGEPSHGDSIATGATSTGSLSNNAHGVTSTIGNFIITVDPSDDRMYEYNINQTTYQIRSFGSSVALTKGSMGNAARAVAYHSSGRVLLSDITTDAIESFAYSATSGQFSDPQTVTVDGALYAPNGMVFTSDTQLVLIDTGGGSVKLLAFGYSSTSHTLSNRVEVQGDLDVPNPRGLAWGANRLFILGDNGRIVSHDFDGTRVSNRTILQESSSFNATGITFWRDNLLVINNGAARIVRYAYTESTGPTTTPGGLKIKESEIVPALGRNRDAEITLTTSELLLRKLGAIRGITDGLTSPIVDMVDTGYIRRLPEMVTIIDNVFARTSDKFITIEEVIKPIQDAADTARKSFREIFENNAIIDVIKTGIRYPLQEIISITDAIDLMHSGIIRLRVDITILDMINRSPGLRVPDALNPTDAISLLGAFGRSLTDTLTRLDDVIGSRGKRVAITFTDTITDAITRRLDAGRTLNDIINRPEEHVTIGDGEVLYETITITDAIKKAVHIKLSSAVSAISDSITAVKDAVRGIDETSRIRDVVYSGKNRLIEEDMRNSIIDSVRYGLQAVRRLTEIISISDGISTGGGSFVGLRYTFTHSDAINAFGAHMRHLSDPITAFSDRLRVGVWRTLTDSHTVYDSLGDTQHFAETLSETFTITDRINSVFLEVIDIIEVRMLRHLTKVLRIRGRTNR